VMVEFMQQGTTVTSEVYCETLKELRRAIQNKRHRLLTFGILVVLLHDSTCPYIAARTRALLEHINWELFDHPFSALISLQATSTCSPIWRTAFQQ
jgi:hypothetical protein